ncbi:unnamed protein product [Vicia faba]|uniref:Hexosyltransferase n=1 Tax=Vicia faba TaxID=3906 RepID=A0AAV0ZCZ0_VICFA|nr:unnamed protein product [Vicia faba]
MVTAYDYPSAVHLDMAAIDICLVGDSASMVVHGHDTTLPITLDEMLVHCRAVARGAKTPLLVGDLPFGTYECSSKQAVDTAVRILKEGRMDAIKLEGGSPSRIVAAKAIVEAGIAVIGHVGLTPQAISVLGGFRPQGRNVASAVKVDISILSRMMQLFLYLKTKFAPGVSHIEPGGLSFRDVLNILHNLQGDVVAGDVVELNPQRDTVDGMTAMVAAKLVTCSKVIRWVLSATNEEGRVKGENSIEHVTYEEDAIDADDNDERLTKSSNASDKAFEVLLTMQGKQHIESSSKVNNIKHRDETPPDVRVRKLKDKLIQTKVYLSLQAVRNIPHLTRELRLRVKEVSRTIGEASKDSDLPRNANERMKAIEQSLMKARKIQDDCATSVKKLRAMLHSSEDQLRVHKKQTLFLTQLTAKTLPKGLHCLPLRLTTEYYNLNSSQQQFPNQEKLEDPGLYHYAIFSDNILATVVVVNSTAAHAKDSSKHVFHIVTDRLNYAAMRMWFLADPPGKAAVQKDLTGLWSINLKGNVNGAVETCTESFHQFDRYLDFSNPLIAKNFDPRACGWAYGMKVFDLVEWKKQNITEVYHNWQKLLNKVPKCPSMLIDDYVDLHKSKEMDATKSNNGEKPGSSVNRKGYKTANEFIYINSCSMSWKGNHIYQYY